jgi:type IV pilus assembly protein PilM
MALRRRSIGVDFGATAIRAVELRARGDTVEIGERIVLSRAELAESGVDIEDAVELAEALASRIVSAGMHHRGVVLGLDGREAILRYTHVPPMPRRRLEEIVAYEVKAVEERMEDALASDFIVLPVRRDDGEQTVLMGFAKEGELETRLRSLETAGVSVSAAIPAPLALFSAWEFFAEKLPPDSDENDLVLAIDVGAQNTHFAVILDNRLVLARSASFGGERFTEALVEAFSVPRDDAETRKLRRGGLDASIPGVDPRLVGPLRSVAGQLLQLAQSTVRLAASQTGIRLPSVTRLWMTGSVLRLPGLAEFLERGLGARSSTRFSPAAAHALAGESANPSSEAAELGLAIGLASIGLRSEREREAGLEILPIRYRKRRRFRERTIWAIAALAFLALFVLARLGHGLWRRAEVSDLEAALRSRLSTLESKQAERAGFIQTSSEIRARIQRWLDEGEPTAFQAFLFQYFGESLRPEIRLDSLELISSERPDRGGFDYEFHVRGRVSNEQRKGFDWILDLQAALAQEERVADVRFLAHDEEGPWYTFTMAVRPSPQRI